MAPSPSLAALALELARVDAIRAALSDDAGNHAAGTQHQYDAALLDCWAVLDRIAEAPATSLPDLRIKARAFDWSARLLDDEPYRNPSEGEEKILRHLVSGLLDERFV